MTLINLIGDDCFNIILDYKNQIEIYEAIEKTMKDMENCIKNGNKKVRIKTSYNVNIKDFRKYLESIDIEYIIKVKCEVKNKGIVYEILPDSYKTPIDYVFTSNSIYRDMINETIITGFKYTSNINGSQENKQIDCITIYTEMNKDDGVINKIKRNFQYFYQNMIVGPLNKKLVSLFLS